MLSTETVDASSDILRFNGQFPPESPVHEHQQFHLSGPTMSEQGIQPCPNCSSGEQHIIDENDVSVFDQKVHVCALGQNGMLFPPEVIPMKSGVNGSKSQLFSSQQYTQPRSQAVSHKDPSGLKPD
jgi:hypothetical protein